jgi:hypothetical protein
MTKDTSPSKIWSTRNRDRVRALFWHEWDPIGVKGLAVDWLDDEYNTYADKAYVMLMVEGRSAGEIADYLFHVSSVGMGLAYPKLRPLADEVAAKLVALKPSLEPESETS